MTDPNKEHPTAGADGVVLDDLETLRTRLTEAEQERDKFRSLLQRTQADFENYQKRMARDAQQERKYWNGPLVLDFLNIIDNLERAKAAAEKAEETGPLTKGVTIALGDLYGLLRRHEIYPIPAVGQPFDPNVHQAVMQEPTAEYPPGTVVRELQMGFRIHDRVLRPTAVAVAIAPS